MTNPLFRKAPARAVIVVSVSLSSMSLMLPAFASGQSPQATVVAATDAESLRASGARVDAMLRSGELDLVRVDDDTQIQGRTHERLAQRYQGAPGVRRRRRPTTRRPELRTVFGRVYDGIAVDATPRLDGPAAAAAGPGGARGRWRSATPRRGARGLADEPRELRTRLAGDRAYRRATSARDGQRRDRRHRAGSQPAARSAAQHRQRHRRARRRQEGRGDARLAGLRRHGPHAARPCSPPTTSTGRWIG